MWLPHAHLLVILESNSKILNLDSYDLYVGAELPGYEETHLRSLVIKHMMHGPCGAMNPKCPCMKTKDHRARCRFNYPKNFTEQTTCSNSCYPVYKRQNNGDFTNVKGQRLDNRWVIPYNPYLLAAFDCHINVEICSTIKAMKYIYKYVYKGHDRVSFNIEQRHLQIEDEISAFQYARWVSPPEVAWRIFGFEMYDMYPPIIPLQVHLPNMQYTTFYADTNMESLIRDDVCKVTMLTGYFTTNASLKSVKWYLYYEFLEWFVWDSRAKKWTTQKQRSCIGRMTYVSPSEGERYYLRLLLCNIHGATSFDDLLTIDGCKYSTFKEACKQYGFIDQDYYADACMEEAAAVQMPHALWRLFLTLLVCVDGVDPRSIWTKFYPSLSEDFARAFPSEESRISYLTYTVVEKSLESMGTKIGTYNLSVQHVCMAHNFCMTRDISDAITAPIPFEYMRASESLNSGQRSAFDAIMDAILNNRGGAFFIDGPGGPGKTFLYCSLYARLRSLGMIVLPTATSGIAAYNIPTERIAHSRFKIPIDSAGSLAYNVLKQSSLASLILETALFIWDEASMDKQQDIEALDALLRDLCSTDAPFGGKTVVLGGDFRQVLPVLPHKPESEAISASLVNSFLWPKNA